MQIVLALCASCALGCALPSVALGGSVSFGETRGSGELAERKTVRSALWVAVSYSARTQAEESAHERAATADAIDHEAIPCAFDVACSWEREAAYEASWGRAAIAPQPAEEGEAWP